MRTRLHFVAALALGAALASGCAKAHARVAPDTPPLAVPPAPPRVVEPTDVETPAPVPLPQEPARHATPAPARPARPSESPRQEPKAEPHDTEPPATPEGAKPDEPPRPATSSTTLQTTPTQAEGEVERNIRGVLDRARGDLSHVDYRRLNADARTQYDAAKRFIQQADDALKAKNLLFAQNVAGKAAAIAAQLAGR